ncbi:MAG: SpoIIE family protein phosphatase [Xanthobacteraceae bacterium]
MNNLGAAFANDGGAVDFQDKAGADVTDARILIIDDSVVMRKMIAGYLGSAGFFNLTEAEDGVVGLQAARTIHPDLIIADLNSPDLDAIELCRLARSDATLGEVPIIVEAGGHGANDMADLFTAGASDLIARPINPRELIGRVRVHLERRRLVERLSEFQRSVADDLIQARAMQESLLPSSIDIRRLQAQYPIAVAGFCEPSIGLGGDIWGITPVDSTRVKIFTVDFAGHGVQAALNTFRLHSFLLSIAGRLDTAAAWLNRLNLFLCDVLQVGQFATMFCGVIDFSAGTLQYATASAPSPLIRSGGSGRRFELIDGTGFPLGVTKDATYEDRVAPFGPDSTLFLYSDALIETPQPPSSVFTRESLRKFFNAERPGLNPAEIQDMVLKRLYAQSPEKPSDDLTVVTLCHVGGARSEDKRVTRTGLQPKPAMTRQSERIREYVASHKSAVGRMVLGVFEIQTMGEAEKLSTMLATNYPVPEKVAPGIWELLSNAIEHGNLEISYDEKTKFLEAGGFDEEVARRLKLPEYTDRVARVEFEQTADTIYLRVIDEGPGFDFAQVVDMELSMERPNGRGIYIARSLCFDRLSYRGRGNMVEAATAL